MGKGKKKAKVPYYYMSLHYGICHGPIQSINQIAIRDKPVFCGTMDTNGVIYVNMPELFGGQTAEGGVYGAIECYLGTGDQKMTQLTAKRFDKTSDTMLGYRGLANVFFRGPDESEELLIPPPTTDKAPNSSSTIFDEAVYEYFFGERPPGSDFDPEGGFHWAVNNPYMPSAWVHVTRCPTPLGEQWAYVLHPPSGPLFDWAIASVPVFAGGPWGDDQDERLTVYLDEISPQVDAGHVVFTAKYTTLFSSNGTSSSATVQGQQQIWAQAYDEDGNSMDWADTSDRSETTPYWIGGELVLERQVPVGCRKIEYMARNVFFSFLINATVTSRSTTLTVYPHGKPLCDGDPDWHAPYDANGAYMIAEALMSKRFGMGAPQASLDVDSFVYAAETLWRENFGLSMLWREQTEIEDFIKEVLDHIQGVLFLHPKTGLWTLKLIRNDYNLATVRTLDSTNSVAKNRQRKASGELVNEIIISYKDYKTEGDKTITFQDLGSIAQIGQVVSSKREYYGIRSDQLASIVGARDIRAASYPLFSCEVEADRSFRDVTPGEVLKLTIPEDGIEGMAVRVLKVNYGKPKDRKIRLSVIEEIFSLAQTDYTVVQESEWTSPDVPPEPVAYKRFFDIPYPILMRNGATAADLADDNFPDVPLALFAGDTTQAVISAAVYGPKLKANGSTVMQITDRTEVTPYGLLPAVLANASTGTISGARVRRAARPNVPSGGDLLYIDGATGNGEIVMLDGYNSGTDLWTIRRGVYDTVPKAWASGSLFWYLGPSLPGVLSSVYTSGVGVNLKVLPRTGGGLLNPADTAYTLVTPSDRPYAPHRPANCQIGGAGFGTYSVSQATGIPPTVPLTWANRNRLMEDGNAPLWTAANVTPEDGQTTLIRVYEQGGTVPVAEYTGLTGTSFALPIDTLLAVRFWDVEFKAERDGFESIQGARRTLSIERLGYGQNYGYDYGQNDGS